MSYVNPFAPIHGSQKASPAIYKKAVTKLMPYVLELRLQSLGQRSNPYELDKELDALAEKYSGFTNDEFYKYMNPALDKLGKIKDLSIANSLNAGFRDVPNRGRGEQHWLKTLTLTGSIDDEPSGLDELKGVISIRKKDGKYTISPSDQKKLKNLAKLCKVVQEVLSSKPNARPPKFPVTLNWLK